MIVRVVAERLAEVRVGSPRTTVLVGAGSSRSEAAAELAAAASLLSAVVGRPVPVLTMADDLPTALAALAGPVEVATYLLAEGQFVDRLLAASAGMATVAAPIGVHPALVGLVWQRYDQASGSAPDGVR
jgi:sirohydrochlorin ferrochelatase